MEAQSGKALGAHDTFLQAALRGYGRLVGRMPAVFCVATVVVYIILIALGVMVADGEFYDDAPMELAWSVSGTHLEKGLKKTMGKDNILQY